MNKFFVTLTLAAGVFGVALQNSAEVEEQQIQPGKAGCLQVSAMYDRGCIDFC